jgi:hypothetical protein
MNVTLARLLRQAPTAASDLRGRHEPFTTDRRPRHPGSSCARQTAASSRASGTRLRPVCHHARHVHPERRAAFASMGLRAFPNRARLDRKRLLPGVRRLSASVRAPRRRLWPASHVHDRSSSFLCSVAGSRLRTVRGGDSRRPAASGVGRGHAQPCGHVHPDGRVSRPDPRQCDERVECRVRGRRCRRCSRGGAITAALGWEWVFFAPLPVTVLALAGAPVLFTEFTGHSPRRSFDVAGAATVTGGALSLIYAILSAADHGWLSWQTPGGAEPRRGAPAPLGGRDHAA